ncbi:type IV pilus assembly protein PilM [Nocardioides sambongensis]|uniref:type IV pilus assembly protein PilM n=1 Tax=Nocardioides sambongensis TaxID=2589074 RepID=UPI00112AEC39|nr:type IV pilus assembly protein PilM [Nocardioides sambongensis]
MAKTLVGLDIGSSAVRAVTLSGGRTPKLVRAGAVALPRGAVEAGTVRNPRVVTEAIRTLWQEQRMRDKDVCLGVGSGSVLVRQLELDWMPPADLKKALRYQVADLLPVSVDDANIDHVALEDFERADPDTGAPRRYVRILLVATARGAVDEMVRCVQAAGLRPQVADLSAFGLVRAAARAVSATAGTEAIVDVGADKIAVAVHTAGRPHFVRVVAGVGGSLLTQSLVERLSIGWPEAEALKHTAALPSVVLAPAATAPGTTLIDPTAPGQRLSPAEETGQLVLEGARQLVAEIKATLDFHSSSDHEHLPERLLVTGGGARLTGFPELVQRTLGLPTRRFDPHDVLPGLVPRRKEADPMAEDPTMMVPIGLALAGPA